VVHHRRGEEEDYAAETWNAVIAASGLLKFVMGGSRKIWLRCSSRTRRVYTDAARLCGRFEMLLEYSN
jgi:hypothetical protein